MFLKVVASSIGLLHVRHWRASVAWSIPAKLLKIRVVPHGGTQKLPPALGDWATDKLYDWADKMVHAAPSRCCVVVGDLNAHVGYVRHPEREALNLERETMAGCGDYQRVQRSALVQVLPGSAHGDGEHTFSQEVAPHTGMH